MNRDEIKAMVAQYIRQGKTNNYTVDFVAECITVAWETDKITAVDEAVAETEYSHSYGHEESYSSACSGPCCGGE